MSHTELKVKNDLIVTMKKTDVMKYVNISYEPTYFHTLFKQAENAGIVTNKQHGSNRRRLINRIDFDYITDTTINECSIPPEDDIPSEDDINIHKTVGSFEDDIPPEDDINIPKTVGSILPIPISKFAAVAPMKRQWNKVHRKKGLGKIIITASINNKDIKVTVIGPRTGVLKKRMFPIKRSCWIR